MRDDPPKSGEPSGKKQEKPKPEPKPKPTPDDGERPRHRKGPPPCTVTVTHIKFNHAPAAHTVDALNIRRDKQRAVTVPEWETGRTTTAEDSPAAYALQETNGQRLKVKVRFTVRPVTVASADVRATGGGVLGAIDPLQVNFKNGVSDDGAGGDYIEIELRNQQLHQRNRILKEDVAWQWQYRCPNQAEWADTTRTLHRIYAVLRAPPAPWSQANPADYPWTDVLDHVCADDSAGGESDDTAAATAIVRHIFESHGASYNTQDGGASYAEANGTFKLTLYLGNLPNIGLVGCYDGAAAVTAFSAAVGCPMVFQYHQPWGYLNRVALIGQGESNNPLFNSKGQYPFPGCRAFRDYGRVAGVDEICRSLFANHAYGEMAGKVYDATVKLPNAWLADVARADYLAGCIDESLAPRNVNGPLRLPNGQVRNVVFTLGENVHRAVDAQTGQVYANNALSGLKVQPQPRRVTLD